MRQPVEALRVVQQDPRELRAGKQGVLDPQGHLPVHVQRAVLGAEAVLTRVSPAFLPAHRIS